MSEDSKYDVTLAHGRKMKISPTVQTYWGLTDEEVEELKEYFIRLSYTEKWQEYHRFLDEIQSGVRKAVPVQ